MADPQFPEPVKLFAAVLWRQDDELAAAVARMEREWGAADFAGADVLFDMTDYYEPEMGPGLLRRLVSFERRIPPESIREAKLTCNRIEDELRTPQGRTVNLDIGFLDHNKVVLASAKYGGHKIYLGNGIYADMILRYREGAYRPFEWTFPDFRDGRFDADLAQMRRIYLEQRRQAATETSNDPH